MQIDPLRLNAVKTKATFDQSHGITEGYYHTADIMKLVRSAEDEATNLNVLEQYRQRDLEKTARIAELERQLKERDDKEGPNYEKDEVVQN